MSAPLTDVLLVLAIAATSWTAYGMTLLLVSQRAGVARRVPLVMYVAVSTALWCGWVMVR